MAFVDDLTRAELLSKALDALSTADGARSNEIFRDIVQTLTRLCNKNQKEIANELSQLAKGIDEQGKSGESFEFKQRTCAVMLELSMEDRRRAKVDVLNMEPSVGTPSSSSVSAPSNNSASAPSNNTVSAPGNNTASAPPNNSVGAPSNNTVSAPSSNIASAPSNNSVSAPSTNSVSAPSLNAALPPAKPAATAPSHGAPSQSFDPASTEFFSARSAPSSTRMIGVDTREMEPITVDSSHSSTDPSSDIMRVQSSATAIDTALPFLNVEYLYMGSKDYDRDLTYYTDVLRAQEVWKFDRFGSRITAFSLSAGPLILLADHREGPSCQPVFRVSDLASCARDLGARGWKSVAGPFGTPNGEAYSFEDPSGNRFAILQIDETSTDRAYFDPTEGE